VKYGVRPGSVAHCTELFGPMLGVMQFETLDEAIDLVNATGYGLTSGLQSLDDREIERWKARIRAGNLYVNKPTVGAIVLRQPFGGLGRSSFGPGMKAGGPNYVAQFMHFEDTLQTPASQSRPLAHADLESLRQAVGQAFQPAERARWPATTITELERRRLLAALASYDDWAREEFLGEHDHFRLLGEDNIRRYLPFAEVRIRVHPDDTFFDVAARAAAARAVGSRVVISYPNGSEPATVGLLDEWTDAWAGAIEFHAESDEELGQEIAAGRVERVRYAARSRVPGALRVVATEHNVHLADATVLAQGRIELLWYVREQSVSYAYHRYGNLGARANEPRTEPD
jgi:RHH-type proline utilization regulon transcriptional repressor/proline dehydrogenase/delta 1-pyrroline-5-carboxylate dehydrogenase